MFPVAHLTLHSQMSGCRWVITPLWCPGWLTSVLYSFYVYSSYLVLLSFTSFRSITVLLLYCAHHCLKYSPSISNFLEEISSLPHSIFFPLLLIVVHWGRLLISPCYSLEPCFQVGISFLFSLAFLLLHFLLQGHTFLYSRYLLTSYFCTSVPYDA